MGNCVFECETSWSAYSMCCTGHRVVLQCNLLMGAFLHLVSTFTPGVWTACYRFTVTAQKKSESFALLMGVACTLPKFFLITDLASAEGRGAGNIAEHMPMLADPAVHHFLFMPPWWSHSFFFVAALTHIRPNSSEWMSFVAVVLKKLPI